MAIFGKSCGWTLASFKKISVLIKESLAPFYSLTKFKYIVWFEQTDTLKMNPHLSIEIFPAEKSCEQGCAICPLARKDGVITATEVDLNVQKTFSVLERFLATRGIPYDLHGTSTFELAPKIRHPYLIHMARFETRKETTAEEFSFLVRDYLHGEGINPRVLGFSLVPKSPLIGLEEKERIASFVGEVGQWYFKDRLKKLQVTIRTNLIRLPLFEAVESNLFGADNLYLQQIIASHAPTYTCFTKPYSFKNADGSKTYQSNFLGTRNTRTLEITNRVMGVLKVSGEQLPMINKEMLYMAFPCRQRHIDFAIAPKGVMLMHSSLTINNPILWLSHKDFLRSLRSFTLNPKITFLRFVQNLIVQNEMMYDKVLESKDADLKISLKEWMQAFEQLRPMYFK